MTQKIINMDRVMKFCEWAADMPIDFEWKVDARHAARFIVATIAGRKKGGRATRASNSKRAVYRRALRKRKDIKFTELRDKLLGTTKGCDPHEID